jgi:hypothetical protein
VIVSPLESANIELKFASSAGRVDLHAAAKEE